MVWITIPCQGSKKALNFPHLRQYTYIISFFGFLNYLCVCVLLRGYVYPNVWAGGLRGQKRLLKILCSGLVRSFMQMLGTRSPSSMEEVYNLNHRAISSALCLDNLRKDVGQKVCFTQYISCSKHLLCLCTTSAPGTYSNQLPIASNISTLSLQNSHHLCFNLDDNRRCEWTPNLQLRFERLEALARMHIPYFLPCS